MSSYNDITGDKISTRGLLTKEGEAAFDRIFGVKKKKSYGEDWQSEERDTAIAKNGNTGEHYEEVK
jgi:hypothetical protein